MPSQGLWINLSGMFGLLREPRILIGITLMVLATALGAISMQRASERVSMWQLDRALGPGDEVHADDVHLAEVAGDVGAYASAEEKVVGRVVDRAMQAGELLPLAALAGHREPWDEVMVPADALHMPDGLVRGDVVDVWVSTVDPPQSMLVLARVRVVRTITADVGGGRGVALAVPPQRTGALVMAMRRGDVDVVRVSR